MSTRALLFCSLVLAPYAYLAYFWVACFSTNCLLSGDDFSKTFLGVVTFPFAMLLIGFVLAKSGRSGRTKPAGKGAAIGEARSAVRGDKKLYQVFAILALMIVAAYAMLYFWFATPEEGRDSLGRICETNASGTTTCCPDPNQERPSELDRLNEMRRRGF